MLQVTGELRIGCDDDNELLRLLDWLRREDVLRGRVHATRRPIRDSEMGGVLDLLTVATGAGGVSAALARTLSIWFKHRRSDVKITITNSNGDKVDFNGQRVDPETVLSKIATLLDNSKNASQ